MFFGQDWMEITLKLTLIPLKITIVINFHSQCVFTYTFSLHRDTFLQIEKIDFQLGVFKKKILSANQHIIFWI
jgi:hypothetical protein